MQIIINIDHVILWLADQKQPKDGNTQSHLQIVRINIYNF